MEYSTFLSAAIQIAKEAGEHVRAGFYQAKTIEFKDNTNDLVTETDKKSESIIITGLKKQFPDHIFLGEEGAAAGEVKEELTDSPTWIIDPIDGTTNFVHRVPLVAISIGFSIKKEVVVGVVYNPILNELFSASKGGGAFLNGNKISSSPTINLKESLVAVGFPYDRDEDVLKRHFEKLLRILKHCRDLRRDGSAALDMCSVAIGRFDIYFEYGIHAWDLAAGSIIVSEAGGIVADPDDEWEVERKTLDICERKVLVGGNKELTKKFLDLLHGK